LDRTGGHGRCSVRGKSLSGKGSQRIDSNKQNGKKRFGGVSLRETKSREADPLEAAPSVSEPQRTMF